MLNSRRGLCPGVLFTSGEVTWETPLERLRGGRVLYQLCAEDRQNCDLETFDWRALGGPLYFLRRAGGYSIFKYLISSLSSSSLTLKSQHAELKQLLPRNGNDLAREIPGLRTGRLGFSKEVLQPSVTSQAGWGPVSPGRQMN